MNTRTIGYIDDDEDILQIEVDLAFSRTIEENIIVYCKFIISNYAIAGIDVLNYPIKREIYYIQDAVKSRDESRDSEDLNFLKKLKNKE